MDKIFEWLLPIKKDDGMVLRGIRVGETAPVVRLHLIDDSGKGADITGVDAVSVVVERSDGMKVALTLSTQAVLCFCPAVVELSFADERLSAVAGLCVGVIDFYSGDIRMTSARFRYNVEPGIVVSDNEVAGDPEYSMFVGAMTDLAKLNEDVSEAENARNVFEVFDPEKEYVRGNKVAYGGASYVLVAESAKGLVPTIYTEDWLCIAEGSQVYYFPMSTDMVVGETREFGVVSGFEERYKEEVPDGFPGIDFWRAGDIFICPDSKILIVENVLRNIFCVMFVIVKCVADAKGKKGDCVFISDENGNVTYGNNIVNCKAFYIKSIDLDGKKIYLTDTKALPVISTADNTDTSFETPDYEIGRLFNIINQNQYLMRASIVSVQNNVVTYDGDLGFTEIYPDDDYDGHTFCVPEQPEIGVVQLSRYSFGVGDGNITAGRWAASVGRENVGMDYSFSAGKRNRAVYTSAALGEENDALGQGSFVACVKNKTTPKAYGGFAIGIKTVSNAYGQSVRGMYNAIDEKGEFLDIVGNGTGDGNRSNAYTLDKKGNARYTGKVYQENDAELATKAYAEKLGAKLSIEPNILFARKDDKLYSTARDSCNIVEKTDSDGIVYDRVTPLNHASKLLYDKYTEQGKPFEIPLSSGKIWLKLLMRSNQAVTPTAELYQVSTESGAALSSIKSVATKAMQGSGEWEEVIIPFEGYIANAYKAKQIHIRLAGYDKNGSDFYDASGKLIGSPYFDIAGWAVFTDEEDFNRYEFYNEMVGIGSLNLPQLYDEVKELKSRLENGGAASGAMVFKGSVNVLPEKPQKGEVYKVTAEIYEGELKEYYVESLTDHGQMDWNRYGYDFKSENSNAIPVFQEAFDAGLNGIPCYVAYYPYYSTPELLKFVEGRPQYKEDDADLVIETVSPPGALTYSGYDITIYIGNPNPIYVEGDIIMFDGESWNKL